MNTLKRFLVLFVAGFCMLGLGEAANAADQFCFRLGDVTDTAPIELSGICFRK